MSLFSFSNNSKEEISAVFHIGSGSVTGYIVKLSKKEKPEIIYSKISPISFQKNLNLDRHLNLMISSLDSVAKDLQKQGLLHLNFTGLRNRGLKKAYYMLSSPWCISQTREIKMKNNEPFEVSHDTLIKLLSEQEKEFISDNSSEDSIVIEKKIIESKLNGYKISQIYGKKAKEIELTLFLSLASKSILDKIKNAAGKHFNFRSENIHSFTLSSFSIIRDFYPQEDSFIYIDVHGELTDLSVVKDSVFIESLSFPVGRNAFIRQLSEELQISADEVVSLINIHSKDKADISTSKKIASGIEIAIKNWSESFHTVLASLSLRMNLPRTIFITVNDNFSSFWAKKLKEEKFSQFSMTEESFNVIILDNKRLREYCKSDKSLNREPVLELECLFLNKIFNLNLN